MRIVVAAGGFITYHTQTTVKNFALLSAAYRFHAFLSKEWGGGGGVVVHFFFVGILKTCFASLCSFICLQAVYQLSGPED